jgi:O-succinylbenzoic acid--CoA ligase
VRELIALDLPAGPAFLQALLSAWEDGDAVLPLDSKAPPAHTAAMLDAMRPAAVVDADGERHKLSASIPVEEGDALVVLTSGTTGQPKGAVHTHRGIEYAAFCSSTAAGVIANSCWLACLPLSHVGGLSVVTRAVLTGTALQMLERADPAQIAAAQREGATHVSLVPTLIRRIDPEPFHSILLGGSAIPVERPSNTIATYGMTETFGGVVYEGLALNGVEMRTTPTGLIELRSPTMLRSYRDGSNPLDAQGWLRTGDVGQIDSATGMLTVLGRVDEMIVTGGEKVWPHAVEAVLLQHGSVSEVAVIGVADPEWGQRVVALVVAQPGRVPLSLQAARELVRNQLPVASAPKEIRLVDSLPRTSVGKLRRMTLTEQHSSVER